MWTNEREEMRRKVRLGEKVISVWARMMVVMLMVGEIVSTAVGSEA